MLLPQQFKTLGFATLILTFLMSCGASKRNKVVVKKSRTQTTQPVSVAPSSQAEDIIDVALSYEGTRYKYGGTTKKGMDCSGLIYTAFKSEDILMPRTTTDLSSHGDWVDVKKVIPGDLVFFATRKNSRKINHVGIVTEVRRRDFSFIHASSSRGVMVSKLSDTYWYQAYVQARRVL